MVLSFNSNFLYIYDSFENFNFKLLMTFNDFIELLMKKNLFESSKNKLSLKMNLITEVL
jgi:hypothetical protein